MKTLLKTRQQKNGSDPAPAKARGFRPGSIEAELAEIASKIPKRELDRLPSDLASNVDYYLYGARKR